MKNFRVYQLPVGHVAKFMRLSFVKEHNIMPKLEDYKLVYEGEFEPQGEYSEPDQLYMKFQDEKPEGYTGHSISMSDVVEIDGKYYYCDDYGWEEISFQTEEEEKGEEYTVTLSEQFLHFAKNGDILNDTIKVGEWKVDRIWERQGGRRDRSGNLTVENMWSAKLIGDPVRYMDYTRKQLRKTISGRKVTVRVSIPKKNVISFSPEDVPAEVVA
ncbi:YodL-like [Prevotella sp. tc2-28]|uniref:YodL domain-containing protein n=1 Tax=Prevotella sp. tc2-28 TaxID=1761888 RepID=UPI00089C6385|nr:YodL domain-containing protein [Prevotella sp. tc2-28]SEA80739.1 YodL-like [Prevotella sp. tc2-28]